MLKAVFVAAAAIGLMALSPTGEWRVGDAAVEKCIAEYANIDRAVEEAGTADAEYARIDGFPYFRINRFLASYDFNALKPAERTEWIDQLVQADKDERAIEIGNLPATKRGELYGNLERDPVTSTKACADSLRAFDHLKPEAHKALPPRALVPASDAAPAKAAVRSPAQLAALTAATPPLTTGTTVFEPMGTKPMSAYTVKLLVDQSRTEELKIPEPKEDAAERLFGSFAPMVRVSGEPDESMVIPVWKDGKIDSEYNAAVAYAKFSQAKWKGAPVLQINYLIWFKANPLDGLIWRVTLGANGKPLAYDTVRMNGSGYLLLLESGLQAPGAATLPEIPDGSRLVLTVDGASHDIVHVGVWDGVTRDNYLLVEYDRLRRLYHHDGETRSLFDAEGRSGTGPGAPRQWAHHRLANGSYFDAPNLLEKMIAGK
ncbi:hypothetical protein [Emcibacter sp. SYSU 3D8]|uniref:hypothetical protein n=1 Tax=Emcibacter sp. SYSU 3D8 TaxID=3133969 RepID=UPI0031FEB255